MNPLMGSRTPRVDPINAIVNRKVRRNPRPLGRGQGARMQITKSTLEVGESPPSKEGFFNPAFRTTRGSLKIENWKLEIGKRKNGKEVPRFAIYTFCPAFHFEISNLQFSIYNRSGDLTGA